MEPEGALDRPAHPPLWPLVAAAAGMVLCYAWAYLLGEAGAPPASRRLLAWAVIASLYALSIALVWRRREAWRGRRVPTLVVIVGAVAMRAVVLSGEVPDNFDLGRHLWEGRVLLEGRNPYAAPPCSPVYEDLRARLEAEGDDLCSGRWLAYADVRSVYGPLATGLFALPHLLPLERVLALRLLMTLSDLATVLVLVAAARALRLPGALALVYAWSPVCVNGFADRGQIDAALVLFVALALLLLLRQRPAWAGVAFAAALLVKVSPLLLALPLVRVGGRRFGLTAALVVVAGVAPFAGAGLAGLSGFAEFARRWHENDALFSVALMALGPLGGVIDVPRIARALMAVLALAYAGWRTLRLRPGDHHDLTRALAEISAAVILLSPVTYPWYACTLLAFACFAPRAGLIALSLAPMLWYTRFLPVSAAGWRGWRPPVYAAVLALLAIDALRGRRVGLEARPTIDALRGRRGASSAAGEVTNERARTHDRRMP